MPMQSPNPLLAALAAALLTVSAKASETLAESSSAFERAFADSPVDWMPWGSEALERAQATDKPIFLFLGGFTDQLARSMRQETFARSEIAEALNADVVSVVADRKLHPELTAFLETYVRSVKQKQGWPLNVWLTPEGKPFEGASYLPPADEWGMEGFPNVLQRVTAAWQSDPQAQRSSADAEVAAIKAMSAPPTRTTTPESLKRTLEDELAAWISQYDANNGGFGEAPKRLQPELLRAMLGAGPEMREASLEALRAIVASPVRDPLDGGFFSGAHDAAWRQPVLQKRLADQARMALALLDAAQAAPDDPRFPAAARQALAFAQSLAHAQSGYIGATDGTADSIAPSYFWTVDQIRSALGVDDSDRALELLGIAAEGNLGEDAYLGMDTQGRNLPRAEPAPENGSFLRDVAAKLLEARRERPEPARDSLASAGDHGLLLTALTRAGEVLQDGALAKAADTLAAFVEDSFVGDGGRLLRVAPGRDDSASPRDHALVIAGLLAHSQTSGDNARRDLAGTLLRSLRESYLSEDPARFFATSEPFPPGVWVRAPAPPPGRDEAFAADTALLSNLGRVDADSASWVRELAGTVAAAIADSPEPARGDQLLALQSVLEDLADRR